MFSWTSSLECLPLVRPTSLFSFSKSSLMTSLALSSITFWTSLSASSFLKDVNFVEIWDASMNSNNELVWSWILFTPSPLSYKFKVIIYKIQFQSNFINYKVYLSCSGHGFFDLMQWTKLMLECHEVIKVWWLTFSKVRLQIDMTKVISYGKEWKDVAFNFWYNLLGNA